MSTSKFLHLFVDSKAVDPFEIQATANDAIFSYANKPLKMNGDLQYKSGVAYVSLVSKLGLVDASIASEATTARAAELVLRNDLATEASRAIAQEGLLDTWILAENASRTLADTNFQTALASETLTRQTSDTTLTSAVNFEIARAQASESVLNGLIASEASTARAAELVLRNDLATEVSDRKSAISGEAATRLSADNALGVRIDNEITRATGAEVSNFQTLDGYINVEKNRAITKENSLQTQLNFFVANVDSVAMDSLAEIVSKLNSAGTDLYQRVLYLESVVSTLRGEALYAVAQPVYTPGIVPSIP